MQLQQGEQEVVTSNGHMLVLTNRRVHLNYKEWGKAFSITIYLEDISSVQSIYKSAILFIILAAAFCLLGVAGMMMTIDNYTIPTGMVVAGLICFVLWWMSRKRTISIHPNGGRPLEFEANDMDENQIEYFLDQIQEAKTARVNELYKL